MPNNLLITGRIRSGKSTLLKTMIDSLEPITGGYFAQRLFILDQTRGFRLVDLSQELYLPNRRIEDLQAFSDIFLVKGEESSVNEKIFRTLGVTSLRSAWGKKQLILMDELGTIEATVPEFMEAVYQTLDRDIPVLGILKKKAHPFLDQIKSRADVQLLDMDQMGCEEVQKEVQRFLVSRGLVSRD